MIDVDVKNKIEKDPDGLLTYEYIANNNPSNSISDISVSCLSHLVCFAAEESRVKGSVVNMEEYCSNLKR